SNERWTSLVSGPRITGAPDIVVEILSPGAENRRRDLSVKRQLYAKYGVKEYWAVDPENRSVDLYGLVGQNLAGTATLMDDDEISSPMLPRFQLKVSAILSF